MLTAIASSSTGASGGAKARLPIEVHFVRLRFLTPGRLLPWIGPALRGVMARQLKDHVCRHAPLERQLQWKHCRGCPYQAGCAYGQTFESEPTSGVPTLRNMSDGQRALTLAPCFPTPGASQPGEAVQARLTLVGEAGIRAGREALSIWRDEPSRPGLGDGAMRFELVDDPSLPSWPAGPMELRADDLPRSPADSPGRLPWLRLELTSPLFLKERRPGFDKSQAVLRPTLAHVMRACLRTVARVVADYGEGTLDGLVDFAALRGAAESVPTAGEAWETFEQGRHSHRGRQVYELRGVTGQAVWRDVPLALLPWLVWGGRLGVGEHRVAGAGAWRVSAW